MIEKTQEPPSEEQATLSSLLEPNSDDVLAIEELLSTGKRNYICGDYNLALENFVELCKLVAQFYGELSNECAEPYLYYGKVLLELARLENGVLGHALIEAPILGTESEESQVEDDNDEAPEDKNIDIPGMVQHAMRDGNLYNDTSKEELINDSIQIDEMPGESDNQKTNNVDDSKALKDENADTIKTVNSFTSDKENKSDEEEINAEDDQDEDDQGDDDKDDDDEMEDEEVSHLQLSWEMFELCVFICLRQLNAGKAENSVKSLLAEAKYGLAQISMESEHYEDAINDFSECLSYYTEILEDKNDRRFAEINYNVGLALSFDKKFEDAVEKFKLAVSLLEAKVEDLETKVKESEEKGGKGKAEPELESWKKEIKELQDLIVLDMVPKIEDAEEMKKQADESAKVIKEATKELFNSLGTSDSFDGGFDQSGESNTEVVHDITNKIRSAKRKPCEDDSGIEAKKIKTNDTLKENDNENTVTIEEAVEEVERLEEESIAVLGAGDENNCTYPLGYVDRQALFSCSTCDPLHESLAGICYGCSLNCHENHDLFELYTKRNFRCDCGNSKFSELKCSLEENKDPVNEKNKYNQNFQGKYCTCERPYPDPEDEIEDEMIQCIICEDWFHSRHLGSLAPERFSEMVCDECIKEKPVLSSYRHLQVTPSVESEHIDTNENIDIETCNETENSARTKIQLQTMSEEKPQDDEKQSCQLLKLRSDGVEAPKAELKAIYLKENWRESLCHCESCMKMYKDLGIDFITSTTDTIACYEKKGKENVERFCDQAVSQFSQLHPVQKVELMRGFNELKQGLTELFSGFTENQVIRKEDIDGFFEELNQRKRRRLESREGIPPDSCR